MIVSLFALTLIQARYEKYPLQDRTFDVNIVGTFDGTAIVTPVRRLPLEHRTLPPFDAEVNLDEVRVIRGLTYAPGSTIRIVSVTEPGVPPHTVPPLEAGHQYLVLARRRVGRELKIPGPGYDGHEPDYSYPSDSDSEVVGLACFETSRSAIFGRA